MTQNQIYLDVLKALQTRVEPLHHTFLCNELKSIVHELSRQDDTPDATRVTLDGIYSRPLAFLYNTGVSEQFEKLGGEISGYTWDFPCCDLAEEMSYKRIAINNAIELLQKSLDNENRP